ncbi:hypothetical protein QFZ79_003396 [Arthrobacter sp. V4I6]|jgi:hypothetical protein|uniref:hypothetical protein n=1 Tax=unclassified Arthrobacter TaxID=235627 RepID=UPI002786876B|nr:MULTISPECIES: hypothetical protein [unclassified Arthrobacter]MDQ0821024.1 hypothetical protein [Arthrobacter sp. V1I7]MDQ0855285.1 hypothetical protein [Arthrobacter sp. V4I6]
MAEFIGTPNVEDVMASLAKQSVFDLPTLARRLIQDAEERTENEDSSYVGEMFVHSSYVYVHKEE